MKLSLQWRHNGRKSPASLSFTQSFVQAQIKENINAPRHWPLWGKFTGDRWIPLTNGQLRGKCFHLMTSSWLTPGSAVLGKRERGFTFIELIKELSENQIKIRLETDTCKYKEKKISSKKERNHLMKLRKKELNQERNEKQEYLISIIEKCKGDSRRMYAVVVNQTTATDL